MYVIKPQHLYWQFMEPSTVGFHMILAMFRRGFASRWKLIRYSSKYLILFNLPQLKLTRPSTDQRNVSGGAHISRPQPAFRINRAKSNLYFWL